MDQRVRSVIDLMRRDLRREHSLDSLGSAVNLSASRLRHLFKAETGTTPSRFLQALRMDEARRLAETTFLSFKEIGLRVGVNGAGHFARDFKRAHGRPPRQHRACYFGAARATDDVMVLDSHFRQ